LKCFRLSVNSEEKPYVVYFIEAIFRPSDNLLRAFTMLAGASSCCGLHNTACCMTSLSLQSHRTIPVRNAASVARSSRKASVFGHISVMDVAWFWIGITMLPVIFWKKRSRPIEAVPRGTRKQTDLLRETLLDRGPLLSVPSGQMASPLDEGRTPVISGGQCQLLLWRMRSTFPSIAWHQPVQALADSDPDPRKA
jgi:hypothetical protein